MTNWSPLANFTMPPSGAYTNLDAPSPAAYYRATELAFHRPVRTRSHPRP
jgi:hypothetical protein